MALFQCVGFVLTKVSLKPRGRPVIMSTEVSKTLRFNQFLGARSPILVAPGQTRCLTRIIRNSSIVTCKCPCANASCAWRNDRFAGSSFSPREPSLGGSQAGGLTRQPWVQSSDTFRLHPYEANNCPARGATASKSVGFCNQLI